MPSRWASALIVGFWLATMGWVGYRAFGPGLHAGEPPPFVIDLADEATGQLARTSWTVFRVDKQGETRQVGRASTWLKYDSVSDTYELHGELHNLELIRVVHLTSLTGCYRVGRDGDLRGLHATARMEVRLAFMPGQDVTATIEGGVRDGRMAPRCRIDALGLEQQLEPIEVPRGSVLNPLQPVNRIKGLRPGRRWRMPMVNPLDDALRSHPWMKWTAGPAVPRVLDAEVLARTERIPLGDEEYECLVIEYRGGEFEARTWVRASDGLVLRQEATLYHDRLRLQRD